MWTYYLMGKILYFEICIGIRPNFSTRVLIIMADTDKTKKRGGGFIMCYWVVNLFHSTGLNVLHFLLLQRYEVVFSVHYNIWIEISTWYSIHRCENSKIKKILKASNCEVDWRVHPPNFKWEYIPHSSPTR